MAHFVVSYAYSAPEADLATLRSEHREYLAGADGLVLSGPADSGRGAVLVFEADGIDEVEAIVAGDPFVAAGFVGEHDVRDWKPILGPLADHL